MKTFFILFLNFFLIVTGAFAYTIDNHIKVDQFGYRTTDKKIAVISNPQTGYNSGSSFNPGSTYQVRRINDDGVVFSGSITTWNSGITHSQSGDKVWWFDFSSVTAPGSYYVFDVTKNVGSYHFEIDDCVYLITMKQAMRMFYYQRCGTPKAAPYAQTGWTDAACHIGSLQDKDCRLYNNTNVSTSKDLSGGWHDAGDYNKYVNFTFEAVADVLFAYAENPSVWGDDYNIPESGNGIPDILDETKYELDWLLKMQQSNGSVLSIIGVQNYGTGSPPSTDPTQRLYGPATTSASFTASALFALAAIQFKAAGQIAYASTLQTASVNAWTWATANPGITFNNSGIIAAGEQEVGTYDVLIRQLSASVFLFVLTGTNSYKTFFDNNYSQTHLIQWGYAYPFENTQQNMLLYYTSLPNATLSVATAIKDAYRASMKTDNSDNLPAYTNKTDAYRAYMADDNYTWGSNQTKARQGIMFLNMLNYKLDTVYNTNYKEAALGFVNYFHGVNPTAFCYLSNMGSFGAENSINEFYHSWFRDGSAMWDRVGVSAYGPAPGYVPGGPNPSYALDACCPSGCGSSANNALCNTPAVTPPLGQPIQKSYGDWNAEWPQDSWTVTEPAIYSQASYVRLLSWFLSSSCLISTNIAQQEEDNTFQIFPNPAANSVFINMKNPVISILVRDLSGRIVFNKTPAATERFIEIQTTNLNNGIYFIEVVSTGISKVQKFVKE